MGAAQAVARVREKESEIRELQAAVADMQIQCEENRKLAIVAQAEKENLAKQGVSLYFDMPCLSLTTSVRCTKDDRSSLGGDGISLS
jgi:hypothetical protein